VVSYVFLLTYCSRENQVYSCVLLSIFCDVSEHEKFTNFTKMTLRRFNLAVILALDEEPQPPGVTLSLINHRGGGDCDRGTYQD
jgi:hypothetical protein